VKKNAADLQRMLSFSKGSRDVPVIVEDGKVTIGYGGS
jgi:glutaredoxin